MPTFELALFKGLEILIPPCYLLQKNHHQSLTKKVHTFKCAHYACVLIYVWTQCCIS